MEMSKNWNSRTPSSIDLSKEDELVMNTLASLNLIAEAETTTEDSLAWVNIIGKNVIKPKEALAIGLALGKSLEMEILFNSLRGKELRFIVNDKKFYTPEELEGYEDDYPFDFGQTLDEMKTEYRI